MDNFLGKLLGTAPPAPVQTAIPPKRTYSRALERRARANGFKSANEMMLWAEQRNRKTGGTVTAGSRPSVDAATMMHPKNILQYVTGKMQGAMGY